MDLKAMQDMIGTREASEILGLTIRATRLLAQAGHLKGIKLARDWRFKREDVMNFERIPRGKPPFKKKQ